MEAFKNVAQAKSELKKVTGGVSGDTIWLTKAQPLVLEFLEKIATQKQTIFVKETTEIENLNVREAMCPICGGEINRMWYSSNNNEVAWFICECWTPTNPDLPRHIFRICIDLPETVYIKKGKLIENGTR